MGSGESVGIVDATASVCVCVGEDYDVFVRQSCKIVVEGAEPQGCQIAVRIESAEMRTEGRVFPVSLKRDAHSALGRREGNGNEIEAV